MSKCVFLWVLAPLLCSATVAVYPAVEAAGRIAVIVLDDTGVPVPGARVSLTGLTEPVHKVAEADAAGQAAFDNLPDGDFSVAAEKDGFVRAAFGSVGSSPGIPIALAQGSQFSATVVMQRLGAIAGSVFDQNGNPAAADVRVLRVLPVLDGSRARRVQVVASSRSSVKGVFQFSSVVPGEYLVCARAMPMAGPVIPVPACFGGGRDPSGGALVRVAPADVAGNVNLFVTYEAGARLRGVVIDPNGQAAAATQVHVVGAVDNGFGITTLRAGPAGDFSATLVPGIYNLVVPGSGATEVMLSAGATGEVLFPLGRGASFSGRLVFGAAGVKPALQTGTTIFELVPVPSAYAHLMAKIPVRLNDADSLTFGALGIPPGGYQVRLSSALSGWLPAPALAGERDLLADGLHVLGADQLADISLTLIRADAEVTGRVMDSNDVPVFDRKVLVFPADRRYWSSGFGRVRWAQPSTTGRFEIAGLPPGRYLLAVIADAATEEGTPLLLEVAMRDALPIEVGQGQRVIQAVRVTTQ